MYNQITIDEALALNNCIFIDVRSPKEHSEATIPNSINIPIFTDSERDEIGKVYKQKSKDEAKALGVRFASTKLESIYHQVKELSEKYENVVIFCWRGGMRSTSVCSILSFLVSSNFYQLRGGYKSYRKMVNHFFEEDIKQFQFIVVHGLTGVGKTKILNMLEYNGLQVLDLEGIAKNAGSVFGSLLFKSSPPSQKNFEAELFNKLYYSKYKYIIVESESKRIGSVNIPSPMFEKMEDCCHILINTSIENRIANILNIIIKNICNSIFNACIY